MKWSAQLYESQLASATFQVAVCEGEVGEAGEAYKDFRHIYWSPTNEGCQCVCVWVSGDRCY